MKGTLYCMRVDRSRVFLFQEEGDCDYIVVPQTLFNHAYLWYSPKFGKQYTSVFCYEYQACGFLRQNDWDNSWADFIVDKPIRITKDELKKYFDGHKVRKLKYCDRDHAFEIVYNANYYNKKNKISKETKEFWNTS